MECEHRIPTIGIITALPKEYISMEVLLERTKEYMLPGEGASRRYILGEIPLQDNGTCVVVLALLPTMGETPAAVSATRLLEHFPHVKDIIMVGIAGGVPYPEKPDEHVRLGDIVVSNHYGVIQYDFVKRTHEELFYRSLPQPPSARLLLASRHLEAAELKGKRPWNEYIAQAMERLSIKRPHTKTDVLLATTKQEEVIFHPRDPKRKSGEPRVFLGPIASANTLLKDAALRDELRHRFGVKAIEMEAAGVASASWDVGVGYLVVRGICDYGDGRKNDLWQEYAAVVAAAYTRALLSSIPKVSSGLDRQRSQGAADLEQLRSLVANDEGFMRDRLKRFVGRERELAEVHQKIEALLPTGGYLTITAGAGEGKSSLIARLVEDYRQLRVDSNQIALHFIPFTPSANYQVPLLKSLMTRLILIHKQSDLYVQSDERASLTAYFARLLREIARQGKQEIIFIDGLDQLPTDFNGLRDLSFLPHGPGMPPPGIVFVLGTRPNETLRPLQILKPMETYHLPHLERHDFTTLLQRYGISVETRHADQLYHQLNENALFLDLAAQELQQRSHITHEEVKVIIQRISTNPENLFALALERMGRYDENNLLWEQVIKPILGLLLVAYEPLVLEHLKQLINLDEGGWLVDGDRLRGGLERLGGLVRVDEQHRYTLSNLKFRDFLRKDLEKPEQPYVFDRKDEQIWQQRFIQWCEQGDLLQIWQDAHHDPIEQERRLYARQYFIAHLYNAHEWDRLFAVLDEGRYGQAKVQDDPSMRAYVLDLDLGRKAAASKDWSTIEGIGQLAHLWRYTLLRCSLAMRAGNYPPRAFCLMLMLGERTKAIRLAELFADPQRKIKVLLFMAEYWHERAESEQDAARLFFRAEEVAENIFGEREKWEAIKELGIAYVKTKQWQNAVRVFSSLERDPWKGYALAELGKAYAQAYRWQDAERVLASIAQQDTKWSALVELGTAYALANRWQDAARIWQNVERVLSSISNAFERGSVLVKLGTAYALANRWQDAARIWQNVEQVLPAISSKWKREEVHVQLGTAYAQAKQWKHAERIFASIKEDADRERAMVNLATAYARALKWQDAERVVSPIPIEYGILDEVLEELGKAYIQANRWQDAERVLASVSSVSNDLGKRGEVLVELGTAYALANRWWDVARIWQNAERVITSTSNSGITGCGLTSLSLAFTETNRWQDAEQVISSIEYWPWRETALTQLAMAYARVNQWQKAEQILASISDEYGKQGEALAELGKAYAQAYRWQDAERVLASIARQNTKGAALVELGTAYALANRWHDATRIWQNVERVLSSIGSEFGIRNVHVELGTAYALANRWHDAERFISSIEYAYWRDEALAELGTAYALANRWQDAERVLSTLEYDFWKGCALAKLGKAYAQINRWQDAEHAWQRAERIIASLEHGPEERKGEALVQLVKTYVEANRWRDAERIISYTEDHFWRDPELAELGKAYTQAGRWQDAERVVSSISNEHYKAEVMAKLGKALVTQNQVERVLNLTQNQWLQAQRPGEAVDLLSVSFALFPSYPDLGMAFYEAFSWVDNFLRGDTINAPARLMDPPMQPDSPRQSRLMHYGQALVDLSKNIRNRWLSLR